MRACSEPAEVVIPGLARLAICVQPSVQAAAQSYLSAPAPRVMHRFFMQSQKHPSSASAAAGTAATAAKATTATHSMAAALLEVAIMRLPRATMLFPPSEAGNFG
nr:unnamed protein product [Digitaria exilis]